MKHLPNRHLYLTVSLGGKDLIVDAETVGKYLNRVDLKSEDGKWKDADWKARFQQGDRKTL